MRFVPARLGDQTMQVIPLPVAIQRTSQFDDRARRVIVIRGLSEMVERFEIVLKPLFGICRLGISEVFARARVILAFQRGLGFEFLAAELLCQLMH